MANDKSLSQLSCLILIPKKIFFILESRFCWPWVRPSWSPLPLPTTHVGLWPTARLSFDVTAVPQTPIPPPCLLRLLSFSPRDTFMSSRRLGINVIKLFYVCKLKLFTVASAFLSSYCKKSKPTTVKDSITLVIGGGSKTDIGASAPVLPPPSFSTRQVFILTNNFK